VSVVEVKTNASSSNADGYSPLSSSIQREQAAKRRKEVDVLIVVFRS
jgi:hypothetical protein